MAEWQTRRIQNPLPCGFKSHLRYLELSQLPEELLDETDTPFIDNELQLIKSPEDFLTAHEKTIGDMIELAIDSGSKIH